MRIRGTLMALCVAGPAHADTKPEVPKPAEAACRAYLEEGLSREKEQSYDEARARFHTARVRCANPVTLIMIAHTYEQQGDLPRALAYVEEFLAVVDRGHELRAATERSAAALRERVPAEHRINIAAELAAQTTQVTTGGTTSVGAVEEASHDRRRKLATQVEDFDWQGGDRSKRTIERARGFFVGANLAYATMAKVEVDTDTMSGRVDFPRVFGAELQVGYRFFPYLSVALAPQMFFNLQPDEEDMARELEVFVPTTGHLVLGSQWDFNLFAAPGYSVLVIPGADDARGLAFRYGGGPMFHLTRHVSFAGEFSHQIGFQRTERNNGNVDMETSFFSLLVGIRLRR